MVLTSIKEIKQQSKKKMEEEENKRQRLDDDDDDKTEDNEGSEIPEIQREMMRWEPVRIPEHSCVLFILGVGNTIMPEAYFMERPLCNHEKKILEYVLSAYTDMEEYQNFIIKLFFIGYRSEPNQPMIDHLLESFRKTAGEYMDQMAENYPENTIFSSVDDLMASLKVVAEKPKDFWDIDCYSILNRFSLKPGCYTLYYPVKL